MREQNFSLRTVARSNQPSPKPLLLTIGEFCEIARMSRPHLKALQRSGEGPRLTRIGKREFVRPCSAEKWAADRERATARAQKKAVR